MIIMEHYLKYIDTIQTVIVDRPLGSVHPKWGYVYPLNYGYIPQTCAGDGEAIDVYILGVFEPMKICNVRIIAVIERMDDVEAKLVATIDHKKYTKEQIEVLVEFQERFFETTVYM